jgi:hypothetical protein
LSILQRAVFQGNVRISQIQQRSFQHRINLPTKFRSPPCL